MIASKQPRMLDLTVKYADQWNTAWFGTVDGWKEKADELDAACERAGRDPKTMVKTAGVSIELLDASPMDGSYDPALAVKGPVELVAQRMVEYRDAGCDHFIGNLVGLNEEKVSIFAEAARMAGLI